LQRQRDAEVELRHVRSHTRVSGNELADWLADVGREEGGPVSAVCAHRLLAAALARCRTKHFRRPTERG
jgi:hypothetical protein